MAWLTIPTTNLEYDSLAYTNLPQNRKDFWDKQDCSISNGIRTNADGKEIYMRIRKQGEPEPNHFESELNKTTL